MGTTSYDLYCNYQKKNNNEICKSTHLYLHPCTTIQNSVTWTVDYDWSKGSYFSGNCDFYFWWNTVHISPCLIFVNQLKGGVFHWFDMVLKLKEISICNQNIDKRLRRCLHDYHRWSTSTQYWRPRWSVCTYTTKSDL